MDKKLFRKLMLLTGYGKEWLDKNPDNVNDYTQWENLMPLAIGHEISLLSCGNDYEVSYDFNGTESIHGTDEVLSHHIEVPKCDVQITIVNLLIMKLEAEL